MQMHEPVRVMAGFIYVARLTKNQPQFASFHIMPRPRTRTNPPGFACVSICQNAMTRKKQCHLGAGGNANHVMTLTNYCHFDIVVECTSEVESGSELRYISGSRRYLMRYYTKDLRSVPGVKPTPDELGQCRVAMTATSPHYRAITSDVRIERDTPIPQTLYSGILRIILEW